MELKCKFELTRLAFKSGRPVDVWVYSDEEGVIFSFSISRDNGGGIGLYEHKISPIVILI